MSDATRNRWQSATDTAAGADEAPAHMRFPARGRLLTPLSLPLGMLLAWMMLATNFGKLLSFPFTIQFHELGHAMVAWLSGRLAVPLPCGITFAYETQSTWFEAVLVLLFAVSGYAILRSRNWPTMLVWAVVLVAHIYARSRPQIISIAMGTAGGFFGELFFPAAILVLFHVQLADRLRWDFLRFILLVPSCATLIYSTGIWQAAQHDENALPRGSFLGGGGGDIERLLDEHGWTEGELTQTFHRFAHWAWGAVILAYIVALVLVFLPALAARIKDSMRR